MSRRSRIIGFGSAALLVVAGIVGAVVFGGLLGELLALVLIALGLVLATALVFLEVGLSEDKERARRDAEGSPRRSAPRGPAPGEGRAKPRLERKRGSRRRLG